MCIIIVIWLFYYYAVGVYELSKKKWKPPKVEPTVRLSFRVPETMAEDFARLAKKMGSKKTIFISQCALIGFNVMKRQLEPETFLSEELLLSLAKEAMGETENTG